MAHERNIQTCIFTRLSARKASIERTSRGCSVERMIERALTYMRKYGTPNYIAEVRSLEDMALRATITRSGTDRTLTVKYY